MSLPQPAPTDDARTCEERCWFGDPDAPQVQRLVQSALDQGFPRYIGADQVRQLAELIQPC